MGPADLTESGGPDIGPHPHIGLQTVTWLLDGQALHRDSVGSEQVGPGPALAPGFGEVTTVDENVKVRAVPSAVTRATGTVAGRFMPMVKDMAAMFGWIDSGRYVADPRRQEQLFGPVPAAEDAINWLTDELSKARHR